MRLEEDYFYGLPPKATPESRLFQLLPLDGFVP
jgi:hypothetical protein